MVNSMFNDVKMLSNGNVIPTLGFGTYGLAQGQQTIDCVACAIKNGCRHIDNADVYLNQESVGLAIQNCIQEGLVTRDKLFVTSKVPDQKQGFDKTVKCFMHTLDMMKLDYLDLYLIHSPLRQNKNWSEIVIDTWRALEYLHEKGLVKSIGVSNFAIRHLDFILKEAKIKPVCNQIELHPQHQQKELVDFCFKNGIQPVAWSTLNQGRIFKNETFLKLADKYGKTAAQIAIRWSFQKGFVPLASSSKPERIENNFEIQDFELSQEDMLLLDGLDGGEFSNWHDDSLIKVKPSSEDKQLQIIPPLKRKYYLFGVIPFLACEQQPHKSKWYLFGLPILKTKDKICKI